MVLKNCYKCEDSREVKLPSLGVAKRESVSCEEVVNADGVIVRQSRPVVYDASKEINVYKVSDFSIGSLLAAGVTELSETSLSRSSLEFNDNIPDSSKGE